MRTTVEILEAPITVTVDAPQTVQILETPVTVEVAVDGNVTVTESPTTVVVMGGDTLTIQESPQTVEIGGADHPAHHDGAGPQHTYSGLTAGDVLTALNPTSAEFAPPTGGGGAPGDSVVSETTFGQAAAAGALSEYSREDHTHGSPVDPVPAHEAAGDPHGVYPLAAAAETITEPWTFSKLLKSTPPKDSGTATSATTTTVTDTGKAWTVNQWAGGRISISGQQRHIASNTPTVITVVAAFSPAPSGAYTIVPAPSYDVQVVGEAHAQARFGADGVGFGPGTAAQIMGIRRARGDVAGIAANAGFEV